MVAAQNLHAEVVRQLLAGTFELERRVELVAGGQQRHHLAVDALGPSRLADERQDQFAQAAPIEHAVDDDGIGGLQGVGKGEAGSLGEGAEPLTHGGRAARRREHQHIVTARQPLADELGDRHIALRIAPEEVDVVRGGAAAQRAAVYRRGRAPWL